MKDTRLIQLLNSFSAKEIKLFADFIHSPYFNKNEKVMKLADVIIKYYPAFEKKLPTEEKLFAAVFKNEQYDYFKFRNYTSDILELALDFLKTEKLQEQKIAGNISKLENLRIHNQDKIYEKEFLKTEKQLLETQQPGAIHLFEKFRLKKEESEYNTKINPNTHHELTQHGLDVFTEYIVLQCMDYYGLMLHDQMQNNVPYELKLFNEMLAYAEENYVQFNTITRVYIDLVRLMQDITQTERYERLRNLLRENHNKIPFELLERGYVHLVDFCAIQINRMGNNEYVREVHNLHRDILQFHIQTKGNMAYQDFLNVVKIAAVIKEFEWVEKFIHEYGPHLAENERENSMQFSYAIVAYYKEDFDRAIRHMSSVNFKDPIMKIQVKSNTIRYLYEEKLYEQTLACIDAFAHYLRREKMLTDEIISSHEQFIGYVKEMIKIELEPDKREKLKLTTELTNKVLNMNTNYFGTKNWLKKKLGISYQKAV
ncbi:MAG: hypothetical protein H7Y00_10750 [Fimbriimonadaceae bacterium]|nr:hypothetical protein [Chitinophagales bacterium]